MRFDIVNPEPLGVPRGWNNGLLGPGNGRTLFVAGQTATGPDGRVVSGDFVDQFERALVRVLTVIAEAGGEPTDVGRMTVFVADLDAYLADRPRLGDVWRRHLGRHYPAMSLVEVSRLVDDGALVEIEATAVLAPREE